MNRHARLLLLLAVAIALTITALGVPRAAAVREAALLQTEADGLLLAELVARSAKFALDIPPAVEAVIDDQMVVEATLAAHLVAVAELAGLSPDALTARLQDITARTVLDELWITDETGHAYLHTVPDIDFTFSPDPSQQPQAYVFWPLLTGERAVVVQEAMQREVDTQVFKYVGVAGIDRPRIVQVGYNAGYLEQLRQQVGLPGLVSDLVAGGKVLAVRVVDRNLNTLASGTAGAGIPDELDVADRSRLQAVVADARPQSYLAGSVLKAMAPIGGAPGQVVGAVLIELPTNRP
jgi:adenylate cyclase